MRFLPSGRLTPVLPPIAASTIPSSVVATCTTGTPRWYDAAAKPATSVTMPPPTPNDDVVTGQAERAKPRVSSRSWARDLGVRLADLNTDRLARVHGIGTPAVSRRGTRADRRQEGAQRSAAP